MADYIEREAIRNKLYDADAITMDGVAILNNFPATKVEPIINAFWKKRIGHGVYWYACSECGEDVPKNRYGHDYFSRRCPHCGAHMDFESEETDG